MIKNQMQALYLSLSACLTAAASTPVLVSLILPDPSPLSDDFIEAVTSGRLKLYPEADMLNLPYIAPRPERRPANPDIPASQVMAQPASRIY